MRLGRVDTAYGYGICSIHVAYISRSSWDISIYLKTVFVNGIQTYFIRVARLLYTIISETISSLSTNITRCFFHAPDQTIKTKSITCSKTGTTHPLHIKHAVWRCPLCYSFENQIKVRTFFFGQLLMLRHATSQATSCRCATCHLLTINFAKFCQYAVAFSNLELFLLCRTRSGTVQQTKTPTGTSQKPPGDSRRGWVPKKNKKMTPPLESI